MTYTLLILPIALPVLFWSGYHYHKDRHLPEPLGHLVLAFALGIASSYLATFMYEALGYFGLRRDALLLAETDTIGLFIYSILAIGVIEEAAKLAPFLLFIVRLKEFDEPIDGIIYASFIALGFAAIENVTYVQLMPLGEAVARGFASPVVHIVFASIWGYYVGRAKLCRRSMLRVAILALAFTALLHGIYDFLVIALLPPAALPAAALLVAGIWIWRLGLIRDLHTLPAGPCPVDADD